MQGKTQAPPVQTAADNQLRSGVLSGDPGHHPASCFPIYDIRHLTRLQLFPELHTQSLQSDAQGMEERHFQPAYIGMCAAHKKNSCLEMSVIGQLHGR